MTDAFLIQFTNVPVSVVPFRDEGNKKAVIWMNQAPAVDQQIPDSGVGSFGDQRLTMANGSDPGNRAGLRRHERLFSGWLPAGLSGLA